MSPFRSVPAALLVLACAVAHPVAASAPCPKPEPAITARPEGVRLDDYVTRLARLGVFSGAVLVARHDTILLHGGYGLADQRACIPVTRSTAFDIGSVAKTFMAAAVLRLEMEGRLRVGDSLTTFFPEAPAEKRDITVHQLLSHTSGLPGDLEAQGARVTAYNHPALSQKLLALPLQSAPGRSFRYSNAGYALLRLIVERASGMKYQEYLTGHLLHPAGLQHTGWHGDSSLWRSDQVARGAWGLYDSGSPRNWPLYGATFGGGQMVSTPGDLFRWIRALTDGPLLSSNAAASMFAPQAQRNDRDTRASYGYGWELRFGQDGALSLIFHNGIYDNFRTTLRRYPVDDVVIIVTNNLQQQDAGDRADELANGLLDLTRGSGPRLPAATAPLEPNPTLGFYQFAPGATVQLWRATPDRVWIAPTGQAAFDALWMPDSARSALNQRVGKQTIAFLDSLRAGPCGSHPPGDQWSSMYCGFVEKYGPLDRVDLLGVAPLTWSNDWSFSYTTLRFRRDTLTVTWEWRVDQLVRAMSSCDVPEPQSLPLGPLAPGRYISYDWFSDREIPIELLGKDRLRVGDLEARRIDEGRRVRERRDCR